MTSILFVTDTGKNSSFFKQLMLFTSVLSKYNIRYIITNYDEAKKTYDKFKPDIVFFWTFFGKKLPLFRKTRVIGFEVSDTDRLSETAISQINDYDFDLIITPSKWSAQGFSGVNTEVVVLPHAINSDVIKSIDVNKKKDYFWVYAPHSRERKGLDLVEEVLPHYLNHFANARVSMPYFLELIRKGVSAYPLTDELDDYQYFRYFGECEYFLYPVRGGAFEIPIAEALALGLKVAIPERGAWTEIPLRKEDVVWIKTNGKIRLWYGNKIHVGHFVSMDVQDVEKALYELIDFNPSFDRNDYLDYYSPENIYSRWIKEILRIT